MSTLVQNLAAVALVIACLAYVAWQLLRTLRSGNGNAGACCSKGCGGEPSTAPTTAPREQFIPADALRRKRP